MRVFQSFVDLLFLDSIFVAIDCIILAFLDLDSSVELAFVVLALLKVVWAYFLSVWAFFLAVDVVGLKVLRFALKDSFAML